MDATAAAISKYGEVFNEKEAHKTYRGDPVAIRLKPNGTPKFLNANPVPYAIKKRVEREIDKMVRADVLKSVSSSEWASPVVPLISRNGVINIVGDYRALNQCIEPDVYQIPPASEVQATLSGGRYYTVLNYICVHSQLVVTEATARLLTINTSKGLFTLHRLPFNVIGSSVIFYRLMMTLLADLPGVVVLLDEVIVSGDTMGLMTHRLDAVMAQIEQAGLRLDRTKLKFAKRRIKYFDFTIDEYGLHSTMGSAALIFNTPAPENVEQLYAFMQLYNYYGRYVPQKALILEPLYRLLDDSQRWIWTHREQTRFDTTRHLLSRDLRLVQCELSKPLVLTCGVSDYGVSGVVSHVMDDGQERTIAIISRTLHTYERRFSLMEKKAMAIVNGVMKFHRYLMGRFFTIVTDHKPLLKILDPKTPTPNFLSPLLTLWVLLLNSYNYDIKYKPRSQIANVDGLSRWPKPVRDEPEIQLRDILLITEPPKNFPIYEIQIASATKEDIVLYQVSHHVLHGWPAKISNNQLRPYWLRRTKLSIHSGCILLGCRVVIPPTLRETVLRALHKKRNDILLTKLLTRSYVWWPKLNADIKFFVQSSKKNSKMRHMVPEITYDPSVMPTKPWSTLIIDFAGPIHNKEFLIIVDVYSKWPEVFTLGTVTPASVIRYLQIIFATHGLCKTLVSHSGASFILSEVKQFLLAYRIEHVTSGIFLPSTNGLAEQMILTIKEKLREMDGISWDLKILNMLLGLRATPCASTRKSPAELLFNRRLRILATSLRQNKIRDGQHGQTGLENTVMYRNLGTGPSWLSGTIVSKEGPSRYRVKTEDGNLVIKRADELIRTQTVNTETYQIEQYNQKQAKYEDIIEIPSSDEWSGMLGIPVVSGHGSYSWQNSAY